MGQPLSFQFDFIAESKPPVKILQRGFQRLRRIEY